MIRWNMIRKANTGLHYLESVGFESGCSGAAIFEQLQQLSVPQGNTFSDNLRLLLYSPVVYITTAIKGQEPTQAADIEKQTFAHEVFIKIQRYSEAYTLALRDPARLEREGAPNFMINRTQFATSGKPGQTLHALLIILEVRHAKVILLFGTVALLSVGVGVIIGMSSRDVNVGVGVTAGLFQFLTMLQWSYIWAARR
ncbi:hypothetical protein KCU65_g5815, partial [Aureobasidium melanogenum]